MDNHKWGIADFLFTIGVDVDHANNKGRYGGVAVLNWVY